MSNIEDFLTQSEEQQIIDAIRVAEKNTSGEIRVHLEKKSDKDPLERAKEVFYFLKMDKTENKNGVLFYVAVNDKSFSIIGDKGINDLVPNNFWNSIKDAVIEQFSVENYAKGLTIKDLKPTTRSLLLNGLADVLAQQDKNKAAEEQLQAALKLLTDTAQYYTKYQLRTTHVQLANIYSKTKQKALAEAAYEQALFWSNQAYQSNKRREFAKIYVQRGDHF